MPILEYYVSAPPTSAELADRVEFAISTSNIAAKGLLHLRIKSDQQVPPPQEEELLFRIRRPHLDDNGIMTKLDGTGILRPGQDSSYQADSVIIEFDRNDLEPARARVVIV